MTMSDQMNLQAPSCQFYNFCLAFRMFGSYSWRNHGQARLVMERFQEVINTDQYNMLFVVEIMSNLVSIGGIVQCCHTQPSSISFGERMPLRGFAVHTTRVHQCDWAVSQSSLSHLQADGVCEPYDQQVDQEANGAP